MYVDIHIYTFLYRSYVMQSNVTDPCQAAHHLQSLHRKAVVWDEAPEPEKGTISR